MNSEPQRRSRKFSWPLAFTVIALIMAGLLAIIFLRLESWPARTAQQGTAELERVARDVRDAFIQIAQLQPRITVNQRVYVERTTQTAELAVLSRQLEVEHEMLHTWAGSTKRVKLHGTFDAKAGFDLQHDVSVKFQDKEVTVALPHATILGVEQKQVDVLALENGFWNLISAADLESELAILPQLAREKAAESGLAAEAESALQQQLDGRVQTGPPVRITFGPVVPKD